MGLSAAASAQTRPVIRADANATVGWLAVNAGSSGTFSYSQWESSLFGAVGAGWHWTDHLKTEVDFGAGTKGDAYLSSFSYVGGQPLQRAVQRRFSRRIVGVSQQYQFFRNSWFHPHLAAGANLTWETRTDNVQPVYGYDPVARISRQLEPGRIDRPPTEFSLKPFAAAGFKAYMTRRAFFRSDLRVGFKNGIDETLLRFGFGVDF